MSAGRRVAITLVVVSAILVIIGVRDRARANRARYAKTLADIENLQEALRRYYLDYGSYPNSDVGLAALVSYEMAGAGGFDDGMVIPRPTVARPPRDAWGRPFFYQSDGNSYVLESLGASGSQFGTRADPVIIVRSSSTPPD